MGLLIRCCENFAFKKKKKSNVPSKEVLDLQRKEQVSFLKVVDEIIEVFNQRVRNLVNIDRCKLANRVVLLLNVAKVNLVRGRSEMHPEQQRGLLAHVLKVFGDEQVSD